MSGLALLSGYASESDEDDAKDTTKIDLVDNATLSIPEAAEKSQKLPSALTAFEGAPSLKRNLAVSPSRTSSNKISKIAMKRFVPPQVRLERPNVVTEDSKHK